MSRYVTKDKNLPNTIGKDFPWGRLIQPTEAAKALAFMTSEESRLMTGSIIDFDRLFLDGMLIIMHLQN